MQRALALAALPNVSFGAPKTTARAATSRSMHRVRPGDPAWPSEEKWQALSRAVERRLATVPTMLAACVAGRDDPRCAEVVKNLSNPFYIGDQAGGTQISGWVDAWTPGTSAYAISVEKTSGVVAAVNFARDNNLRLVVKGGGHSYQGTSSAPDSLLIWTRSPTVLTSAARLRNVGGMQSIGEPAAAAR